MISNVLIDSVPKLRRLPVTMPMEGTIQLELANGIPILRASTAVQDRIETLLDKQKQSELTKSEAEELDLYEEIDDYLSFLNRIARNLQAQQPRDG